MNLALQIDNMDELRVLYAWARHYRRHPSPAGVLRAHLNDGVVTPELEALARSMALDIESKAHELITLEASHG